MEYIYQLAGLQIACSLPFSIQINAESKEFLHPGSAEAELRFIAQAVDELPAPTGIAIGCRYYDNETTWFCAGTDYPPYAMTQHSKEEIRCFYLRDQEERMHHSSHLCNLFGMERFLPRWDTLLLHCAFVQLHGHAILFSGPSGIGKSTQGDLWQTHLSAELCNGDRAAVRLHGGQWSAYGLPYAGSSRIYRNVKAPCRAIVVLGQATENQLRRLTPREAFTALYPEITLHHWEKSTVERVTALLSVLVQQIPVYRLDCLPAESAVQLLYQEVFP